MGTNEGGEKVCHSETSQVPIFGENPYMVYIYFCKLVALVLKHTVK